MKENTLKSSIYAVEHWVCTRFVELLTVLRCCLCRLCCLEVGVDNVSYWVDSVRLRNNVIHTDLPFAFLSDLKSPHHCHYVGEAQRSTRITQTGAEDQMT